MERTLRIPCTFMRGGTSRGLVFRREDLPADEAGWDLLFLAAIGSPDVRQLDGVGAGDSHTSKIAVVNPSEEAGADLDYHFGEVAITEPRVDYAGNSGNIIAALGLYAVEEGIVPAQAPETLVRVRNLNTNKLTELFVPVVDGRPAEDGDFSIDGVPGFGPRIDMRFPRPEGSLTGRLLPTGEPRTRLEVPGVGPLEVTLLDAANPVVLVPGEALGVRPDMPLQRLNGDAALLERLQAVRAAASVAMGLVERAEDAWSYSNMVPFLVLLFPPSSYPRFDDPEVRVEAAATDLCARVISLGRVHKSINVTVSVAVTAAALTPGTLAHELSGGRAESGDLRIGHPSGMVHTRGQAEPPAAGSNEPTIAWVRMGRTARRILDGTVLIQPYKLRWLRQLTGRGE
ncbi:MAG TPA: PrpF domain-containing protein [bacterium]|nr:PrpF domain-containing protein [bacterium]HKJ92743.1 PrpF domain-containing protein [Longimicrobiales bacterium]